MNITEIFKNTIRTSAGHLVIDCNCGRVHYSDINANEGCYNDGEFEQLEKDNKQHPNKYIYHPNESSISSVYLNGLAYVPDCPCEWEKKYANFIWDNKELIINVIKAAHDEMKAELLKVDKLVENLPNRINVLAE